MLKGVQKIKVLTGLSRRLVKLNHSTTQKDPFKYEVVSPQSFEVIKRAFPSDIQLPSYYETGLSDDDLFEENISNYQDLSRDGKTIEGVRNSCQIAKQVLQNVIEFIQVVCCNQNSHLLNVSKSFLLIRVLFSADWHDRRRGRSVRLPAMLDL